jgi:hypothetical protein
MAARLLRDSLLVVGLLNVSACTNDAAHEPACPNQVGTICTLVGNGIGGSLGDEGPASLAELYMPIDVAVSPDQRLHIIDWNNHRIRAIDHAGVISTVAGSGQLGDGPEGPALEASFNHPTDLTFDGDGKMVIAAWHNSRVKSIDVATGMLADICGDGKRAYRGDGDSAKSATLDLPASVAFDASGALFVMDQANQVIRRIGTDGKIERVAGQCIAGACGEGEVPVVCPGSDKKACVMSNADACNLPCEPGFGGDGGPALAARLAQPYGQAADPAGRITFDASGNLYIADTGNHRIRRVDPDGIISTFAGTGVLGWEGDGVPATEAQLNAPTDVEVSADGTVYVADTGNSCVRAIRTDGVIETVAGICAAPGFSGDRGRATQATLNRPYGIELDGQGNLLIADTDNHRVRRVQLRAR